PIIRGAHGRLGCKKGNGRKAQSLGFLQLLWRAKRFPSLCRSNTFLILEKHFFSLSDQPRTFSQEVISSSPAARFRCGGDGQHGGERRRFAVRREDDGGWRGANGRSFVNAVVARKPAATARRSSEVEDGGGFRVVMTAAVRRKGGWCRERRG
ncbi:hypothetical protein VIGAN_06162900, partial [Vigna angularis var. angularis]